MISYPIYLPNWPKPRIRTITVTQRDAISLATSPFSFAAQTQDFGGDRWEATIELPPMKRPDAAKWMAFLAAARRGRFYLGDVSARIPQSSLFTGVKPSWAAFGEGFDPGAFATWTPVSAPTITVLGTNGARSRTLATQGWPSSTSQVLLAGDYLQVGVGGNFRLHMVLADANSDGSGHATFDIWPQLREGYSDGDPVVFLNPVGQFVIPDNGNGWKFDQLQTFGITFNVVEWL